MFQRLLFMLGTAIVCCFPSWCIAQNIVFSTEAAAKKVGINDRFQVSFVIQNASNISRFEPPSFEGFAVLAGPSQSSQQRITSVNGRQQVSLSTSMTYVVQAKRKGNIVINGATIEIDGQTYRSNPITIQVVPGSVAQSRPHPQRRDPFDDDEDFQSMQQQMQQMQQWAQQQMQQMQRQMGGMPPGMSPQQGGQNADVGEKDLHNNVFIKVTIDNKQPYVGQQINVSYKLYTRLPMKMQLTQLPSTQNGFWSEDFDVPNPPKPTTEVVNGKEYQVFLLKKTALFPQQIGDFTLDAAKAEGIVRVMANRPRQNYMNDPGFGSLFMDDPFFNNGFFSASQYKDIRAEISSQPIVIHVRPLPSNGQPANFTGAVGQFEVAAKIDSTTLYTGGSSNFTITLKGSGNFQLIGAPTVNFPNSLSALDPTVLDTILSRTPTISGEKTFTYNLSPQQEGEFTIPSVEFTYYDPSTGSYVTKRTQPIPITVKKGKSTDLVNLSGEKTARFHPQLAAINSWNQEAAGFMRSPWYWALYLLAGAGFVFLLLRDRQQKAMNADLVSWKNKKANKVAWKRLSQARKLLSKQDAHTAFYEEISKAIWLYFSDKLNIPLSELSKDNIAEKLTAEGIPEDEIAQTKQLLSECEMALYSPDGGQQQRSHTLDEAVNLIGLYETKLKNKRTAFGYAHS